MNKTLALGLAVGILIGTIIGYVSFVFLSEGGFVSGVKSWRSVTSFTLTSNSPPLTNVEIAYPIPNVYNMTGPNFVIKADFWRVRIQSVPYYNYSGNLIAYFAPIPMVIKIVRPPPNATGFPSSFGSMAVLEPSIYGITTWHYNQPISYAFPDRQYVPIEATYTFNGAGTFLAYMDNGTGCFNFAIEEYS